PRGPSVTDGAADELSDFGTVYDEGSSAMLHFRPYKVDPASLSRLATSGPDAATALDAVAGSFGPGVYIAIGGQGHAAEHQAGLESGGLVRGEAEGTALIDPFYDLPRDGGLSGSPAAFGDTAGALAGIPADGDGSYTVYIAAAEQPGDAIGTVRQARLERFAGIRAASEEDWRKWLLTARLPATGDGPVRDVARRALMLIRTAQDRRTGAIVANATTQTPYRQDWVRDGAFFNYALLLAGYGNMAVQHSYFYRGVYRPGGTWDTLYYPDGAEAGFVFPYEIDSQAFALWALWLPYEFGAGGIDYLEDMYTAIRETADAILLCRDPTSGLQCYASEDDAVNPTQGAQGASTVYLALQTAAEAAEEICAAGSALCDGGDAPRWRERAKELREAAVARLCAGDPDEETCGTGRGGIYMVWPSRLLLEEPEAASFLDSHLKQFEQSLDDWSSFTSPPLGGVLQYPMEPLFALAIPETRAPFAPKLGGWIDWLVSEVPEPGVLHYGERIFYCEGDATFCPRLGQKYLHTIGFPHIWSGTETYIAAAFVYGVEGTAASPCPAGGRIGEAGCLTPGP
ncbi:MAG: hypothetical protein ACREQY_14300, partial [Candidatus Binatia bacterium]